MKIRARHLVITLLLLLVSQGFFASRTHAQIRHVLIGYASLTLTRRRSGWQRKKDSISASAWMWILS